MQSDTKVPETPRDVGRFNSSVVVLQLVQSFVFTKLQEELEDWKTSRKRHGKQK
jgi:hypothetical protein